MLKPEIQAAVDLILQLRHRDEEYVGDHWATGQCPRCLAEIALGVRDPHFGGMSPADNQRLKSEHEQRSQV